MGILPWVFASGLLLLGLASVCGGPGQMVTTAAAEPHGDKAAGAVLFHEKGCEHCHGMNGSGGELGPDLSGVGKRKKKPEIEHQIREGGGGMPAFGEVLEPKEIEDLVEFLHAKQK